MSTHTLHRVVAMDVKDPTVYAQYRAGMGPILEEYGGGFLHDFTVADVLRSTVDHPVTRLFVISFPDEDAMADFFSDERYLAVKNEFFTLSVGEYTELGTLKASQD